MENVKANEMKTKMPYQAPEGYFARLQEKLCEIPQAGSKARRVSTFPGMVRNLAWAACAAAVTLLCVNLIGPKENTYHESDDIVEYLIDSGMTLAQIGNIIDYQ